MQNHLAALDRLLRGEFTRPAELRAGQVDVPVRKLLVATVVCGAIFGLALGVYAATSDMPGGHRQVPASSLKVPLLFLFTLMVTFPSLYVFATLAGSRLHVLACLRLLLAAVAVNLGVLASFAPVVAFFTVFTESYAFIVLLDVGFFLVSGAVSLGFLSRAVSVLFAEAENGRDPDSPELERPRPRSTQRRARWVFRVWLLIYGVVGAQMGWLLRPFVGNPELPFTWFRHHRESNIFQALIDVARDLAGAW